MFSMKVPKHINITILDSHCYLKYHMIIENIFIGCLTIIRLIFNFFQILLKPQCVFHNNLLHRNILQKFSSCN